jgi:hypothetical protein
MRTAVKLACLVAGATVLIPGTLFANDKELMVVLDRLSCVPARVVRADPSPLQVLYEVTCKRSERVVKITCSETECHLQPPRRDDED